MSTWRLTKNDLANLRIEADRANYDERNQMTSLIEAYEDAEDLESKIDDLIDSAEDHATSLKPAGTLKEKLAKLEDLIGNLVSDAEDLEETKDELEEAEADLKSVRWDLRVTTDRVEELERVLAEIRDEVANGLQGGDFSKLNKLIAGVL